jgi:hypothetical protein
VPFARWPFLVALVSLLAVAAAMEPLAPRLKVPDVTV